ncbi:MAG: hypothetical protein JSS81_09095 [Acidobacteria bacterium]|nr:hypothetical protein [Acidobacteriota bacterium]
MDIIKLIPQISALKYYLTFKDGKRVKNGMSTEESIETFNTMKSKSMALEQLPYFLNASYFFVLQIIKLQHNLIETKGKNISSGLQNLTEVELNPIAFLTDSFFNSARRAQDSIIPYISRSFSLSLPNSMNDLMKKLQKNEISLPSHIKTEFEFYWNNNGKKLKDYRDLGQHHALLSSEGWIAKNDDETLLISILLPNNPEEKSGSRLSYNNPEVLALPYITMEFLHLIGFMFKVTLMLLPEEINPNRNAQVVIFRNPKIGNPLMHPIQDEKPFQNQVENYIQQLSTWFSSENSIERPALDPNFKY